MSEAPAEAAAAEATPAEPVAESAGAEINANETAAAPTGETLVEAPAEPVLIEVWRQGRRQQGGRPQHRRGDQRAKGPRPEGSEGEQNRPPRPDR
ncbi:MAG: hypothetical protein FGM26_08695 [Beijerinckiaceae bacterium]|nr:hypothetical protein [Beijerinckiaceae bacterium]